MIKAIIFDCFGVLVTPKFGGLGEVKNEPLLGYILELRKSYKTAILSNISSRGLDARFPDNELERYFDVVVPTGQIGVAKPDREAFEITAEKLGVAPEECIMIDDTPDYCAAAEQTGMTGLLYTSLDELKTELTKFLH